MLNYKHFQWSDVINKELFLLYALAHLIFDNNILIITISVFLY